VPDWSGRDYADVSSLQRAMATEAVTALQFGVGDQVPAYEPIAGREGLVRFTQMRALLHR
jgi:hypothetical protein